MPAGRDKTGLDRAAWENLDPHTAIAQRRESTTGVEARSRNNNQSYLEVTSPKVENKTEESNPTDPSALSLLSGPRPGEDKKEYLSRLSSFAPVAKKNGETRGRNTHRQG